MNPEVKYMEKEKYTAPEVAIVTFEAEDIITASDPDELDKQ